MPRAVVTGAGGFIGHHLVKRLKEEGYSVAGIDLKFPEFEKTYADDFWIADLRIPAETELVLAKIDYVEEDVDEIYALAADMGGMGFITYNDATILRNNLLININTLEVARLLGVGKYFFASSVCVYPEKYQVSHPEVSGYKALSEEFAYPADPMRAYGWEKLTAERLCEYYRIDYDMDTRVARFHNTFGPMGTWCGGREKAPAALCRKVAMAKLTGDKEVEVWGDGKQLRTYTYVSDTVDGIRAIMQSPSPDAHGPFNVGVSEPLVSADELVLMIADVAGVDISIKHVEGPEGARAREESNRWIGTVLGWRPKVSLRKGLELTYPWIEKQVKKALEADEIPCTLR